MLFGCGKEIDYGSPSFSLSLNTVIGTDAGEKAIIGTSGLDSASLNIEVDGTVPECTKVSGDIRLNNLSFQIEAEGYLEQYKIQESQEYTKGLFTGQLYKDGEVVDEITFDLLYKNEDTESAVSSVTIGDISPNMEAKPLSLLLGFSDDKINYVTYNEYSFEKEDLHLYPHHTVQTGAVLTDTEGAPLIYLAGYHPYTIISNGGNYGIYIGAWTNTPNIIKFMEAEHDTPIIGNAEVYKAELDISVSEHINVSGPSPDEKASNYSVEYYSTGDSGLDRTKVFWALTDKNFSDTEAKSETPWNDEGDNGIAASAILALPISVDTETPLPLNFAAKIYARAQTESGNIYSVFTISTDSIVTIIP